MAAISAATNANTNGLTVHGTMVKASVDFADHSHQDPYRPDVNGFRLHGAPEPGGRPGSGQQQQQRQEPKRRTKPIKVHSPKVRTGWQKEAVMANMEKSLTSTVKENFDYRPANAYHEPHPQPRGGAGGARFDEIHRKQTHTEMDKVLNPSKEAYSQPSQNPKCPTADSKEFYNRNQKGTYGFGEPQQRRNYPADDPGKVRCPSSAARENLERGRGQAGKLIHQEERSRTPPPNARLGACQETRENYDKGRQGSMSAVLNQQSNIRASVHDPAPGGRVVKGEAAEQNALRNKGQSLQLFAPQADPQPAPRVRPEAKDTAAREGAGMRGAFYGGPQVEPQPAPRVRLAGSEVAGKLQQGSLTREQYNYSRMPQEPQPAPKVRPEAEEYAKRERAVVTKNLLQKYGNLPPDMPPKPHVPPQAWNTAYRSRGGAMKDCINPSKPRCRRRRRPVSAH